MTARGSGSEIFLSISVTMISQQAHLYYVVSHEGGSGRVEAGEPSTGHRLEKYVPTNMHLRKSQDGEVHLSPEGSWCRLGAVPLVHLLPSAGWSKVSKTTLQIFLGIHDSYFILSLRFPEWKHLAVPSIGFPRHSSLSGAAPHFHLWSSHAFAGLPSKALLHSAILLLVWKSLSSQDWNMTMSVSTASPTNSAVLNRLPGFLGVDMAPLSLTLPSTTP